MKKDRLYVANIKKLQVIYKLMEHINAIDSKTEYDFNKWVDVFGLTKEQVEQIFDEMQKKNVGV